VNYLNRNNNIMCVHDDIIFACTYKIRSLDIMLLKLLLRHSFMTITKAPLLLNYCLLLVS